MTCFFLLQDRLISVRGEKFLKFLKIQRDDLEQILTWRTSEFVTRYMYTDVEYDLGKQEKWFESIQRDETSKYWILELKGKKFGLVSINDIDLRHKRGSWAFYVGEPEMSMVAGLIGPHLYNYVFTQIGFHKLYGEVMKENEAVRNIHIKHGCRELGFHADHVYKYDRFHDVYVYEMLASAWEEKGKKFHRYMPSVEE